MDGPDRTTVRVPVLGLPLFSFSSFPSALVGSTAHYFPQNLKLSYPLFMAITEDKTFLF